MNNMAGGGQSLLAAGNSHCSWWMPKLHKCTKIQRILFYLEIVEENAYVRRCGGALGRLILAKPIIELTLKL
jgi:hypothetical protein